MAKPLRVLIVEDSEDDYLLLLHTLGKGGYEVLSEQVDTPEAFNAALDRQEWDCIISDYRLPRFNTFTALATVKELGLDVPFIVVSGTIGEETAVEAMRAGAQDYVMKGNLARLLPAVDRELRETAIHRERQRTEEALRRTEEQLRHSQKMDAVGRLASGVAHDFNNLLTGIIGVAELILLRLNPNDPMRQAVGEIIKTGERAAALTAQLLAFSRKQMLQMRVLNLNTVVENLKNMLGRLIREDIELVTILAPGLNRVRADLGQLEQVILNLLVNSRDAMPEGGKVIIETGNVVLDESHVSSMPDVKPGHYVMLTVSDSGTGMTHETLPYIFEPFFTTKETGQGTGLGLATVYGIIKQSGGDISVSSEPNAGTTFKIYLPSVEEEAEAIETPEKSLPLLRGSETVLVVEDEETVRKMVCQTLSLSGYRALEAANAGEALLICERYAGLIHLLLTDVVMPQMSGRELATRLESLRPNMKVLYMSGYAEGAVSQRGFEDFDTIFLQKPFKPNALSFKVREVLDA